jgi:hypothetical protein
MSIGGTASRKITGQEIMNASKLNVGSTPIVSGTVGRVLFQGTGNILQQSANLFWDNTVSGLQLQTENISSSQRGLLVSQFNSGQQAPLISFQKARGTIATPTDVITGDLVGFFQFSARMGGAYTVDRASFGANAASTSGIGVFIIGGSSNGIYNPGIYVHPSNNVTIGSSQSILTGITDAGFRLDVNGTARVQGNTTVALNQNAITSLNVSNTTNGTASQSRINLTSNNGSFILGKNSTTTNTYKTLLSDDAIVYNTSSDISILNDFASGRIKFATGGVSTPQMTIFSTGNVGINTTTDDGFKLDVNGTARVSGATSFSTANFTSTGNDGSISISNLGTLAVNRTIAVNLTNGSSVFGANDRSYQLVNFARNSTTSDFYIQYWNGTTTIDRFRVFSGGNVGIGTGSTDAGFRLDVNGTARVSGNLTLTNGSLILSSYYTVGDGTYSLRRDYLSSYDPFRIYTIVNQSPLYLGSGVVNTCVVLNGVNDTQRGFGIADDGTPSLLNSAVLQLNSTKRGFLPPRMTNAQRTAIVSPAVGLIVYCTDVTEGLWVYKSTGWTFIV